MIDIPEYVWLFLDTDEVPIGHSCDEEVVKSHQEEHPGYSVKKYKLCDEENKYD